MPGIDRTRPEDMEPIDAAAYLCWGSGRGDLYDAIHATKNQVYHLKPFRDLVYHIASKRYENVDDYIRLAKQAIADYESVLK